MEKLPYKQICKHCNIDFRSKGPNKYFCTRECKIKWNEIKIYTYSNCIVCETQFRIKNFKQPNKFCSNDCYHERKISHPQEFGLIERAKKARDGWSEESWKKGLETRSKNGNIIDWDKAGWKQYWKRCDYLTRKIRKEMLGNWDGIDYIDGKYIKDNLNLHNTHGDYPTLDHVLPRSYGFKNGISPYDITSPPNLKWTTRRNNSSKYNNH